MPKVWTIILVFLTIVSVGSTVVVLSMYFDMQQQFVGQQQTWTQLSTDYSESIQAQRRSKNDIRTQWEAGLVANDALVQKTVMTQDAISSFLAKEITENELQKILDELETQLNQNADLKAKTRDEVEKIYQRDGEDQQNRANPDGIR